MKLNPQLAELASRYNALDDAAEGAAHSLGAEAAAEKNKILIAEKEAKAIADGTKAYQERTKALDELAKQADNATVDRTAIGFTNAAGQIAGTTYASDEDRKTFEQHLLAAALL